VNCALVIGAWDSGHGPYAAAIAEQFYLGVNYARTPNQSAADQWPVGTWVQVEIWGKGNDANMSNGQLKMWMNGVLYIDKSGLDLSYNTAAGMFSGVRLDPYFGGAGLRKTVNDSMEFDHYYVSGR
jgi:hypothetical protein